VDLVIKGCFQGSFSLVYYYSGIVSAPRIGMA
jgi:hypothetical protein